MCSQRFIFILLTCGTAFYGCAAQTTQHDYRLLMTTVTPVEYGKILCRGVAVADYHTCVTLVMEHYQNAVNDPPPMQTSTSGPFVFVFNDGTLYRGDYTSHPLAARFHVTKGKEFCRGEYNAFAGDHTSTFRLRCHAGITGTADIMLDHTGRNGIGMFHLNNGQQGQIVFGHAAVMEW